MAHGHQYFKASVRASGSREQIFAPSKNGERLWPHPTGALHSSNLRCRVRADRAASPSCEQNPCRSSIQDRVNTCSPSVSPSERTAIRSPCRQAPLISSINFCSSNTETDEPIRLPTSLFTYPCRRPTIPFSAYFRLWETPCIRAHRPTPWPQAHHRAVQPSRSYRHV